LRRTAEWALGLLVGISMLFGGAAWWVMTARVLQIVASDVGPHKKVLKVPNELFYLSD
jgi:hypothetical protein